MLKKFILASAFTFAASFSAFSQDSDTFKPQGGDVTTEVHLNLFSGSSTISLDQIRGRYFLSPTSAVRLGFNFSNNSSDQNDIDRSYTVLGISPGIEKHFAGTERLSPYVGGEIFFNKGFASEEGANYEIENGWSQGSNRSFSSFGLRAVAGADFYIARRLYLGTEFGLGFTKTSYSKVESVQGNNRPTTLSEEFSNSSIGTSARSAIRLGFVF